MDKIENNIMLAMNELKRQIYDGFIYHIKNNCHISDFYYHNYNDFDNSIDGFAVAWFLDDNGLSVKITDDSNRLIYSKYLTPENMTFDLFTPKKYIEYLITRHRKNTLFFFDPDKLQCRTCHYDYYSGKKLFVGGVHE